MRIPTPAIALTAVLLTAGLTGCSNDSPAVCSSVNDLKSSIESLKNIDITSGNAVQDLKDGLTAVGKDLDKVKKDADDKFSTQADGVESALDALKTGVQEAIANPSAAAIAAVGTTLSTFATAVQTLVEDIKATC